MKDNPEIEKVTSPLDTAEDNTNTSSDFLRADSKEKEINTESIEKISNDTKKEVESLLNQNTYHEFIAKIKLIQRFLGILSAEKSINRSEINRYFSYLNELSLSFSELLKNSELKPLAISFLHNYQGILKIGLVDLAGLKELDQETNYLKAKFEEPSTPENIIQNLVKLMEEVVKKPSIDLYTQIFVLIKSLNNNF